MVKISIYKKFSQIIGKECAKEKRFQPIKVVEKNQLFPLSCSQERIWFLEKLLTKINLRLQHLNMILVIDGTLDKKALNESLDYLAKRHEILRTKLVIKEGNTFQKIIPESSRFNFKYDTKTILNKELLNKIITTETEKRFDFEKETLCRGLLLEESPKKHLLILTFHSLISDAESIEIIYKELSEIYMSYTNKQRLSLNDLSLQYKDFCLQQKSYIEDNLIEGQIDRYRLNSLSEAPYLSFPIQNYQTQQKTYELGHYEFNLSKKILDELNHLSEQENSTLFIVLLSIFKGVLSKFTNQEDILVSSPISSRKIKQTDLLIGNFVDILLLRTSIKYNPTFKELLQRVRNGIIEAYEHLWIPFEQLINYFTNLKDFNSHPLFNVMFILQHYREIEPQMDDIKVSHVKNINIIQSNFDLTFIVTEVNYELHFAIYYDKGLINSISIENLASYYQRFVEEIILSVNKRLSSINVLSTQELYQLQIWNQTEAYYPKPQYIHRLFEQTTLNNQDCIAVIFKDKHMTYCELNKQANKLANHLMSLGVKPEVPVVLAMSRCMELMIGILGILKAGGIYLPLDMDYPKERLRYMLEDSQSPIIVTQTPQLQNIPISYHLVVNLDEIVKNTIQEQTANPSVDIKPGNLAYIIYTSGSTGQPKGVSISHENLISHIWSTKELFLRNHHNPVLFHSSISVDMGIPILFMPLVTRNPIKIIEENFAEIIENSNIIKEHFELVKITPSHLRLLEKSPYKDLKTLGSCFIIAGEALKNQDFGVSNNFIVYNEYGPTEITVACTVYEIKGVIDNLQHIPIGKPLSNAQIYICDNYLNQVPIGVIGEIYIGGVGLARGYFNKPCLTSEKFIANPFINENNKAGSRLYKTGDLGRYLFDGNIEFIGRKDYQVKIRGFRIELGEIEAIIEKAIDVDQAVVLHKEDQQKQNRLVAYVVPKKNRVTLDDPALVESIRQICKHELTDYMNPTQIIVLNELPVTASGKIDRKSLPNPEGREGLEKYEAPQGWLEEIFAKEWKELLGIEAISRNDNFFYLGGQSLSVMQLLHQLSQKDIHIELKDVFEYPILKELCTFIENKSCIHNQNNIGSIEKAIEDSKVDLFNSQLQGKDFHNIDFLRINNVLLTGASGFLGINLLDKLLQQPNITIYCLIRKGQYKSKEEKLFFNFKENGITIPKDIMQRVIIIEGDLSKKKLGLSEELWDHLSNQIDIILHNGANVHHIHIYESLKNENVQSTIELLNLAITNKNKAIHYISTIGTIIVEDCINKDKKEKFLSGYDLSKWVSEKILLAAKDHGLKISIYRPGNITGNSKTGVSNYKKNHFLSLIKGCIQMKYAPIWDNYRIEMTPVDILSQFIINSLLHKTDSAIYNLYNKQQISWIDYILEIQKYGFDVELINHKSWVNKLAAIDHSNALYIFKSFYLNNPDIGHNSYATDIFIKASLAELNNTIDYTNIIQLYLSYLKETGWIS